MCNDEILYTYKYMSDIWQTHPKLCAPQPAEEHLETTGIDRVSKQVCIGKKVEIGMPSHSIRPNSGVKWIGDRAEGRLMTKRTRGQWRRACFRKE